MDLTVPGKKGTEPFRCAHCQGIGKRRGTRRELEALVDRALFRIGEIALPRVPGETLDEYNKREVMRLRHGLMEAVPMLQRIAAEARHLCFTCYAVDRVGERPGVADSSDIQPAGSP